MIFIETIVLVVYLEILLLQYIKPSINYFKKKDKYKYLLKLYFHFILKKLYYITKCIHLYKLMRLKSIEYFFIGYKFFYKFYI